MTLTLPEINGSSGVWGTILNDALTELDTRVTTNTNTTTANTTSITTLTGRVNGHDTTLATHTSQISNLDTRITTIEGSGGSGSGGFIVCTSTTKPPINVGQIIMETDTGFLSYDAQWSGTPTRVPFPGSGIVKWRQTTTQSIPNNTATTLTWNQISNDRLGGYSGSQPTRYTCQTPGIYHLFASVTLAANATGIRTIKFLANGGPLNSTIATINALGTGASSIATIPAMIKLVPGDYLEVEVTHTGGTALNTVVSTAEQPSITLVYYGAATI